MILSYKIFSLILLLVFIFSINDVFGNENLQKTKLVLHDFGLGSNWNAGEPIVFRGKLTTNSGERIGNADILIKSDGPCPEDGLFGFVSLEPLGDSNIKPQTQYIDEIETESPVPFNILLEFDGEEREGEHEIRITVRYKDSVREEHFVTHDTTIFYEQIQESDAQFDLMQYSIPIIVIIGGIIGFAVYKKRKHKDQEITT